MIGRHGPRTPGMIWVAFVNQLGNTLPGIAADASHADQLAAIQTELGKDKRLGFDKNTGMFGHKDEK